MYHDPYDTRSDHRFRPRYASEDYWHGLDDPREPAVLDGTAQRWLIGMVLVIIGLGIAAALLVG